MKYLFIVALVPTALVGAAGASPFGPHTGIDEVYCAVESAHEPVINPDFPQPCNPKESS